jgi:hypothetical protein
LEDTLKNGDIEFTTSKPGQSYLSLFNILLKKSDYIIFGSLLLLCIIFRVWFWYTTDLTFEDALITFRYAENIAAGNGFVYNLDERVLGTTTPLWTLLLAGTKYAGIDLFFATKIFGILFDTITCLLIVLILHPLSRRIAAFCALLFATSPAIIPNSISGMETSLLLCAMSLLLLGYARKNALFGIGLALTILTRIDGALYALVFIAAGILQDRRWVFRQLIIACLCCAPWYIFSLSYFGSILPQSALAKRAAYNLSLNVSASPFISSFTPFLEKQLIKILIKSGILILLLIGIILCFRKKSILLPAGIFILLYCTVFMTSGIIIFNWYLIPPIFASYFIIAIAIDWSAGKANKIIQKTSLKYIFLPILLFSIFLSNISLVLVRIEKYRQLQKFEFNLRKPLGLWLKENAEPGAKIFLEPLGYIGYYAGTKCIIWDEIGLVNRKVVEHRERGSSWYIEAVKDLKPDYIVQYALTVEENKSEGTQSPIFKDDVEKAWFFSHFHTISTMEAADQYPFIEQKEKKYIIFKKSESTL